MMDTSPDGYKKHYKLCPCDGTPIPQNESVCNTCGLAVPRQITPPVWINWLGILALLCAIIYVLVTLHQRVASTFQHASCTITATWNFDLFRSTLSYTVKNARGQVLAQGDGDLGAQPDTSAYPSAPLPYGEPGEPISDQTSQTTPCWYSPYASPQVIWSQPADSIWWWAWSAGSGVVLVLLYQCIVRLVIYPWQLARRCVHTTGTVVERIERSTRNGHYYISDILYETRTTPALVGYVKKGKDLPMYSKVDVCYDFLNPTRNRKVCDSFGAGRAVAGTFAGVLLILLLLSTQALIVLSAFNFQGS